MAMAEPVVAVVNNEPAYVHCLSDRNRILEVFKDAISKPLPTPSIAVSTMQEAMHPQKQTVLVQDENQLLENGLRSLLQEVVAVAVDAGESVMQYGRVIAEGDDGRGLITRLLDIVLYLCEKGHVEGGMVFQLLEDLTEMSTIRDCKEVFGYIESKQETLGKAELFGRGKLVMLRTCNQLLRCLSKANDVVFCGRILMFLAHFFPLSERSAVNIKGVCNVSNETKYEKEPPKDGQLIDFNFYKTFWSLQVVLNTFDTQFLGDDYESSSHLDEEDDVMFNIKYLTSSNLMSLELKDPGFRRHVLVQCLIIFDFLKIPGKMEKDALRENIREEIKAHEEHVKQLLEMTPPKGKTFLSSIMHILERERNWVWWKRDGCPPFERVHPEHKSTHEPSKRRTRWRLGNKELSLLWKWADQNPNAMTDMERVQMPPITEYWKVLSDDMDPSAGIEEEYHHKNDKVYCWKGLRFTARQDLEAFSRYTEQKIGGVVPTELLSNEVRNMLPKNSEKSKIKGVKKEEDGIASIVQAEDPTEETQAPASLTGLDETTPADAGTPMDFDTTPAVNMDEEINVPESSPLVDHVDSATPGAVDITAEDTSASVPEEAVSPVPPAEASLEVLAGGQGSSPKIL